MTITTTQVLELLAKLQTLGVSPEVVSFKGDFIIYFDDVFGRTGVTESVTISKEGVWCGYGWNFDGLMGVLNKRIQSVSG